MPNILTTSLWLVTQTPFSCFILRTVIAYGESIIKKDTDHCYDPGVKG